MYNIYMLRLSKIVMFLACIIGYFFSLYICPRMECSKKKNVKNMKSKKIKMLLNMAVSVFLGDVGVIWRTSKVIVPIKWLWLCVKCIRSLHILNLHNMRNLCTLAMFSHTTCILFATFDICVGTMWFGHRKEYIC